MGNEKSNELDRVCTYTSKGRVKPTETWVERVSYLVAAFPRVEVLKKVKVGSIFTSILSRLHLTVDHTSVVTLPIDVMHLSQVCGILSNGGGREEGRKRKRE